LLLGHLLLALAFGVLNPLGEAPDEADHWAYVVHLARERELPGAKVTQAKHPPFYHATAALAALAADPTNDFLRINPDVELTPRAGWSPNFFIHTAREQWPWTGGVLGFYLARLWSVLLSTAAVAAVYGLAKAALPQRPLVAIGATALAAFLPEFAFIGSAVSNDGAAALFGTLALWGGFAIYRGGGRFRPGWWTPLALGLGFLTKVSTAALWPVVGLAIVLGAAGRRAGTDAGAARRGGEGAARRGGAPAARRGGTGAALTGDGGQAGRDAAQAGGEGAGLTADGRQGGGDAAQGGKDGAGVAGSWRRWVGTGLLVFGPALLMAAPWLLRNVFLYGDLLGTEMVRRTVDLRTTPWTLADTIWLLRGWFLSFWGKFGGAGHIPLPGWTYWVLGCVTLAAGAGVLRLLRRRDWRAERVPLLLLLLAAGAVALGIWQYSLTALGTDQGRLLLPALGALAVLLAAGLLAWAPGKRAGAAAAGICVGSLALGLLALAGVVVPAFAPPAPVPEEEWEAVQLGAPVSFGELQLVGYTLAPEPLLYWRAEAASSHDWRTVLRVTREDGGVVWEWRRSPGAGRWSTDRWPPGVVVADAYTIGWPPDAGAGRYRVEVGLQPYDEEPVLPFVGGEPAAGADHPFYLLGWIERAETGN
jgi:4-amino-4-deoxy-L-arabinose transferase-like glycosyltransferase